MKSKILSVKARHDSTLLTELSMKIEDHIKDGWVPSGGPFYMRNVEDDLDVLGLLMVKHETV